jgi:hypothetical protein
MKVSSNLKTYLVVDDFFNDDELKLIWRELDYITSPNRMYPPDDIHSGSATQNGKSLKQNMVAPLMKLFNEPQYSDIFNSFDKIYNEEFAQIMDDMSNEFRYYNGSDHLSNRCFVSYYENEDYYKLHRDNAILTFLYWGNKEPKRFTGGDLTIPEIGADTSAATSSCTSATSAVSCAMTTSSAIGKAFSTLSSAATCFTSATAGATVTATSCLAAPRRYSNFLLLGFIYDTSFINSTLYFFFRYFFLFWS